MKARVVRQAAGIGALRAHVAYLQRDGVTRDGNPGRLFGPMEDEIDGGTFAGRCAGDRHHFRFIVAPEDAAELDSLRDFTRDLMAQAERDLGTTLDWVAVDHWNTGHPHVHILVRGRADDGENLVMSRDYISRGMRDRAGALVTQELGPRTELEIRRGLEAEVEAERWTRLDRLLAREAELADGLIDLRPTEFHRPIDPYRIGRMRTLERLGLAAPTAPGRWILADDAQKQLQALGSRADIIKRMHQALAAEGPDRAQSNWVLDAEPGANPVIGRVVAHGLDSELAGSTYAIVDGIDGRVHHLTFPSVAALGEPTPNGIVELRRFEDNAGRQRTALAVRSDWSLEKQITADGATWLDRQLVARQPLALASNGFGESVRDALGKRLEHLARLGLTEQTPTGPRPRSRLLEHLRDRDLSQRGAALARETGLAFESAAPGETVSGVYRRRISLASGRFAMIDNGLGFQLVPWSPSLERLRGQQVDGIAGPGGIERSRSRDLDLGI